jgi:acyl carrier protein
VNSITQLLGLEGSPFAMTVKNKSKYMQLRLDEYKGPPIFHMYSPEHKIGRFFTKSGYKTELRKLKKLIKADMENIDHFVERWHELHKPNQTDWNGNVIILKKNTFEKIQAFIVEKIGVDELEVTRDTLLQDDLGVYGDDALELLIAFSNKFNVDISMFPIDDYFKGEGLTFTLLPTIRKIKPLNVGQLEKAVAVGRLDEEVINS